MDANTWAQIIGTAIGLFITVIALKRDNRKSNEEVFKEKLDTKLKELDSIAKLDKRLSLVEQKVELFDAETKSDINEIKQMIGELFNRVNTKQ